MTWKMVSFLVHLLKFLTNLYISDDNKDESDDMPNHAIDSANIVDADVFQILTNIQSTGCPMTPTGQIIEQDPSDEGPSSVPHI